MDIRKIVTDRPHQTRKLPVKAIVVHATGTTDLDKIVKYYKTSSSGIGPHYVIDVDGNVLQFAEEAEIAYHCGRQATHDEAYALGWVHWCRVVKGKGISPDPFEGYTSWRASWPTITSPLDLMTGTHPNGVSVGIECQSPKHRLPDVFTDAQYLTLWALIAEVAERHGIPVDREHILGHSDVDPIGRCDERGSWDPGEGFRWDRVL